MLVITGVLLLISFIDGYWLIKNKKQYRLNQVSKPSYRYGFSLFVFIYLFINAIFLNVPLILPLFYLLFYYIPWSKVRGAIIIAIAAILILPMWIDIPPYLGTSIQPYINFEVDHKVFDSMYGYFLSTENYYAYSNTNEESFVFEYYKAKDSHILEETIKKHQNIFTPFESEFDACFKGEQNNKVFYNIVHNKQFLLITTTPNNAEGALDFAYEKLGVN